MSARFGFISTYPPTQCGLATFTSSLMTALTAGGADSANVARLLETPSARERGRLVISDIVAGDPRSAARSVGRLNNSDVVIVQHEFGIFGGPDGDEVLGLLSALTVPTIVVLHTVLSAPTAHQREVLEAVVRLAGAVVTMSEAARQRLTTGYQVAADKIHVIAHGAPDVPDVPAPPADLPTGPPTVLTWGLLGPGKGIEWGIDAMAQLQDLPSGVRYVVSGQTHPKVMARDGEAYRVALQRRIEALQLTDSIRLDRRYLDDATLAAQIAAADVVLLPYDSTDQVTSGVLIEAVAAGKPVVASCFPHAVELLSDGAGRVVPHRDAPAIATALREILTDARTKSTMAEAAARVAPDLRWSAVADRYRMLTSRLLTTAAELAA